MKTEFKKLPKSQIQIDFELDAEEFKKRLDSALLHLKGHVKMDGFRQGHVPANIVEEKIGPENLLMEAGDLAVKQSYTKFVTENNLEPIGDPEVKITKIAKGSPFLFAVTVAVLPEIKLPDYKEIVLRLRSGQASNVAVDEKEIQDTLAYLQKSRAKFIDKAGGAEKKDYVKISYQNEHINGGKEMTDMFIVGDGGFLPDFEDNLIGMEAGDEKEFTAKFPENAPNNLGGKEGKFNVKMLAVQTMELPQINDEFARGLGVFDSLVALKDNLKEGITAEKQENEKQRRRGEILEKISAKITFDLPEKMVAYEQERLFEDMKNGVASQFKISFEEYLTSIKKTEEEIKKSFRLEAEKRIKNFLTLRQVGKTEKVEVSKEELEDEMNRMAKSYSKEQLEKIDMAQLREYSKGAIFNEKVFQKLETFSK